MTKVHFYKYHGTGNDFVLIDNRVKLEGVDNPGWIRQICHRRFGIGADGLMLLENSPSSVFTMRYFNSDGGESTMCGNGGRCIAAFAAFLQVAPKGVLFEFDAVDGKHYARVDEEIVTLKMVNVNGIKDLEDGYFLNTGSPHLVVITDDVERKDVFGEGGTLRHDERFKQGGGTNVNFLSIGNSGQLRVRTFERGVEDETWSCGTGSVAAALVAHHIKPEISGYTVKVQGGVLKVNFEDKGDNRFENIWLKGPAQYVFEGDIEI